MCGNSDITVWERGDPAEVRREVLRKLNAAQCLLWADQVLLAGRLLQQVMAYNPSIGSIAELEKALFMIGFNVDPELPPLPLPQVSP